MQNNPVNEISQALIKRLKKLESDRAIWEGHWQEISDYVLPRYGTMLGPWPLRVPGQKRTQFIYDSTACIALEHFAATMESMLTPRTQRWHSLRSPIAEVNENVEAQQWYNTATNVMFANRYSEKANFASQMNEVWMSLGSFGSGALFIDDDNGYPRYYSVHLSDLYFVENAYGLVDTIYRKIRMTARQAAQKFGDPNIKGNKKELPENLKLWSEKEPEKEVKIIHVVMPKIEARYYDKEYDGMEFASYYFMNDTAQMLRSGGYRCFPYAVSRYVLGPNESYGRSPAMTVLPDIKMLNQMKKTQIRAAHLAIEPPILAYDDGVLSEVSMKPGAVNFGGVNKDGRAMIQPFNSGVNMPISETAMEQIRKTINEEFFVTLFQILTDNPRMTATEVLERVQEKGSLLAPTMGRQQSEMLGPLIQRELDILIHNGMIPPAPQVIIDAGGEYTAAYDSPLSRSQRAEDITSISKLVQIIMPFAQARPDVWDNFNTDEIVRTGGTVLGVPFGLLSSRDDMAGARQQRAQQQAQEAQIANAPGIAGAVKDVAQAGQANADTQQAA